MTKTANTTQALVSTYSTMSKKIRSKSGTAVKTESGLKQSETISTDMDALQDGVLRALELMAENRPVDPEYLPAMAAQCRKNNFKRESRRGHADMDDYKEIIPTVDMNNPFMDRSLHAHILSQIRPADRALFEAYYINGLTQSEIQVTMADVYTDQSAVSRALSRLNDRISRLNLKQLVDSRFVIGLTGAEHHTVDPWSGHRWHGEPEVWGIDEIEHYQAQERILAHNPHRPRH